MAGKRTISVLHDFDNPYLSGRHALRAGLKLILYAASKRLPFLRPFVRELYQECYSYCKALATLDRLAGVVSTFGIKPEIARAFPSLKDELRSMGFPVHDHYHFSKEDIRWDPPLDVGKDDWFFDRDYARTHVIPPSTEWAVFHADYPFLISAYLEFLKQAKESGRL